MKRIRSIVSLAVLTAVLLSALPAPSASVSANSGIVVNTHQDSFSLNNDGVCSLREAITIANQGLSSAYGCSGGSGGTDTITFAGNYTITLGSQLPAITSAIIIQGNGADNTIAQASATNPVTSSATHDYRVLEVTASGSLTLNNLTVRHGRCYSIHYPCGAGGVYNLGTLHVNNSIISHNFAFAGGGGIYTSNGTLSLTNVAFNNNHTNGYGGGLRSGDGGNVTLSNVTFIGNQGLWGGGMANTTNSNPTLTEVTFSYNTAQSTGGGFYNEVNSSPSLSHVIFEHNYAQSGHGGGMHNSNNSNPSLTNVMFDTNSASSYHSGGGGLSNVKSGPTLTNVIFVNNITAGNGGGMLNDDNSHPLLKNVTFSGNTADLGGGVANFNNSSPVFMDSIFSGNSAHFGGGMYNEQNSSPAIANVTFDGNYAFSSGGGGGMLNFNSSSPSLTNVTFSNNYTTPSGAGGGMLNNVNSNPALTNVTFSGNSSFIGGGLYNVGSTKPILKNVLIANSIHGTDCLGELDSSSSNNLIEQTGPYACGLTHGVNGNIIGVSPNLGPLANNGGFTQTHALLPGSPAIDAGTNTGCPITDQRGVTRPQGSRCDIGAYESTAPPALKETFRSNAKQDGWILESSETSNKGGTLNKGASTLNVGDDAANKQYRAVLSFGTAALPDDAVITKVTLRVKRAGTPVGGGNPITIFGGFMVDVKKGNFGTSALQLTDFQTKGNKTLSGLKPALKSGWYTMNLTTAKAQINLTGNTQIRLRFKLDDNNNFTANFLKIYSGNAGAASRPQLIVEYYVP
jgi:CSLREA domain-containing protein